MSADAAGGAGGGGGGGASGDRYRRRRKQPNFVRFYELLEVEYDVSDEELRRAYKRQALRLHPDKGGDQERFNEMKAAYDVLKDPRRRRLYEDYGPDILRAMEQDAGMDEYFAAVMSQSFTARLVVVLFVFIILGFVLLFPILLSVKWDYVSYNKEGPDPLTWVEMFIPLWILHGIRIINLIFDACSLCSTPQEIHGDEFALKQFRRYRTIQWASTMLSVICNLLFITSEAFIGITLDQPIPALNSWFLVLLPAMIGGFLFALNRIITINEAYEIALKSAPDALDVPVFYLFVVEYLYWPTVFFVQLFSIAKRANYDYFYPMPEGAPAPYSWFVAFLPIILGTGIWIVFETFLTSHSVERHGDSSFNVGFCSCGAESRPIITCINTTLVSGFYLLVVLLFCGKLQDPTLYSAWAIWSTVLGLASIIVCFSCAFLCCVAPKGDGYERGATGAGEDDVLNGGIDMERGEEGMFLLQDQQPDLDTVIVTIDKQGRESASENKNQPIPLGNSPELSKDTLIEVAKDPEVIKLNAETQYQASDISNGTKKNNNNETTSTVPITTPSETAKAASAANTETATNEESKTTENEESKTEDSESHNNGKNANGDRKRDEVDDDDDDKEEEQALTLT